MKELIRKILFKANRLNVYVNRYKRVGKEVGIPSLAYINWGIKLMDEGKTKEALKKFETSIGMGYQNPEAYINISVIKAKENKFEEAKEFLHKAIRMDNTSSRAYCLLAAVYSETGCYKLALKNYKTSLRLDPRNSQTYISQAIFYAKYNKQREASESFQKACILNPSNLHGIFLWGVLLTQMNKYEAAIEKFQKVHSMLPFHADAAYYLAFCFYQIQMFEYSAQYASKSLAADPKKLDSYIILAESYMNLDDEEKCLETYKRATEHAETSERFFISRGLALQYFKRWEEAEEYFKQAIELEPENFFPYFGLSVSYLKTGKEEEALEVMYKVTELNPDHTTTLYNLGQHFFKKKDYKKAVEYFLRAINSSNDAKHIYFNIANCYHHMGDYKTSLKYWEKTVEYNPDNIDAKVNLANTYSILGDKPQAIRKIRSAYLADKNNPKITLVYAILLLKNDEFFDAIEKFEKTFELDKTAIIAVFGKVECLIKMKKIREGLSILNDYEEKYGNDREFLMLKILAYFGLLREEENDYLIETTISVCDKMFSVYGEEPWIKEKYNEIKRKQEEKEKDK